MIRRIFIFYDVQKHMKKRTIVITVLSVIVLVSLTIIYIYQSYPKQDQLQKMSSTPSPTVIIPTINPCNVISSETSFIPCRLYIVFNPDTINKETKEDTKVFISQILQKEGFENFQVLYTDFDQHPQTIINTPYQSEEESGIQLSKKYDYFILSYSRLQNPELGE